VLVYDVITKIVIDARCCSSRKPDLYETKECSYQTFGISLNLFIKRKVPHGLMYIYYQLIVNNLSH